MYDPASPLTPDGQISAAALRQMAEGAAAPQAYMIGGSSCVLVTGQGTVSVPIIDPATPLTQFVVVQEYPDYLACIPFQQPGAIDPISKSDEQVYEQPLGITAPTVNVAKPYLLQQYPWTGKLVNQQGAAALLQIYPSGLPSGLPGSRQVNALNQGLTIAPPTLVASGTLVTGTVYLYFVVGIKAGAAVEVSNVVGIATAAPNLSVMLTWSGGLSPVDSLEVWRSTASSALADFGQIAALAGGATTFTDTGGDPPVGTFAFPANTSVYQQITPSYMAGDIITAAPLTPPYTAAPVYGVAGPVVVIWQDVNEGGRTWESGSLAAFTLGSNNWDPDALPINQGVYGMLPVNSLYFGAADGYHLQNGPATDNLPAGSTVVRMIPATKIRQGAVSVTDQTWAGQKTFTNSTLHLGTTAGDQSVESIVQVTTLGTGYSIVVTAAGGGGGSLVVGGNSTDSFFQTGPFAVLQTAHFASITLVVTGTGFGFNFEVDVGLASPYGPPGATVAAVSIGGIGSGIGFFANTQGNVSPAPAFFVQGARGITFSTAYIKTLVVNGDGTIASFTAGELNFSGGILIAAT